jgi:hypothetical protein
LGVLTDVLLLAVEIDPKRDVNLFTLAVPSGDVPLLAAAITKGKIRLYFGSHMDSKRRVPPARVSDLSRPPQGASR